MLYVRLLQRWFNLPGLWPAKKRRTTAVHCAPCRHRHRPRRELLPDDTMCEFRFLPEQRELNRAIFREVGRQAL